MNVRLVAGFVLVVFGLIMAIVGISGVGEREDRDRSSSAIEQSQSQPGSNSSLPLAVIAGLSLAAGGALIGIGMGNFQHPRIVRGPRSETVDGVPPPRGTRR